eukprot:scaffold31813_cov62-Phaeocystis_antarctica.AAC.5
MLSSRSPSSSSRLRSSSPRASSSSGCTPSHRPTARRAHPPHPLALLRASLQRRLLRVVALNPDTVRIQHPAAHLHVVTPQEEPQHGASRNEVVADLGVARVAAARAPEATRAVARDLNDVRRPPPHARPRHRRQALHRTHRVFRDRRPLCLHRLSRRALRHTQPGRQRGIPRRARGEASTAALLHLHAAAELRHAHHPALAEEAGLAGIGRQRLASLSSRPR